MQVTIGGEPVQHCTPPLSKASVLTREYDGITPYSPPSVCSLEYPTLTVVHGDLHGSSCTAEESHGEEGLATAVVGQTAAFSVISRDAFGNIRYHVVHRGYCGEAWPSREISEGRGYFPLVLASVVALYPFRESLFQART